MFIISERYQLNICKHKQQLNDFTDIVTLNQAGVATVKQL
jgi:hypothetical protein